MSKNKKIFYGVLVVVIAVSTLLLLKLYLGKNIGEKEQILIYYQDKVTELKPKQNIFPTLQKACEDVLFSTNDILSLIVSEGKIKEAKKGLAIEVFYKEPKEFKISYNNQVITPTKLLVSLKEDVAITYFAYQGKDWSAGPFVTRGEKVKDLKEILSNLGIIKDISITKEITITTDKTEYEQGETIRLIVKNTFDKNIWYWAENECQTQPDTAMLFTREDMNNIWLLYFPTQCSQESVRPIYKQLKPEESVMLEFNWEHFLAGPLRGVKGELPSKYKIVIWVFEEEPKDEITSPEIEFYSNEFTIIEK